MIPKQVFSLEVISDRPPNLLEVASWYLGHIIIYVADVPKTVVFYETTFSLEQQFIHDKRSLCQDENRWHDTRFCWQWSQPNDWAGDHTEWSPTGRGQLESLLGHRQREAFQNAVTRGCDWVTPPTQKPWGQTVCYVRDVNSCLVEMS